MVAKRYGFYVRVNINPYLLATVYYNVLFIIWTYSE
jgi:hypothetical protein